MNVGVGHFAIERTVEPAVEPVSLAQAKAHLRVDHSDEDDLMNTIITAARMQVETFARISLVTQTWRLTLDQWPDRSLWLPMPPLQSVSSITHLDTAGVEQTLVEGTDYEVDSRSTPGRIYPTFGAVWPTTRNIENAIAVTYVAGYGDNASDVPRSIYHAILLTITRLYDFRGDFVSGVSVSGIPLTSEMLLWPYRDYRFV